MFNVIFYKNTTSTTASPKIKEAHIHTLKNAANLYFEDTGVTDFDDWTSIQNGTYMFNGCTALTSFQDNNKELENGAYMFYGCTALSNIGINLAKLSNGFHMFRGCTSLTKIEADFNNVVDGTSMFNACSQLSTVGPGNHTTSYTGTINAQFNSLKTANSMFANCVGLNHFRSNLHNLTSASNMFQGCTNLSSFISSLDQLKTGGTMFKGCSNLTIVDTILPNLLSASEMFSGCSSIKKFDISLSNLIEAGSMFYTCTALESFTSNTGSLTSAWGMFKGCTNLTTFVGDLTSLVRGDEMFSGCKLTPKSVFYICDTIFDIAKEKSLCASGQKPYVQGQEITSSSNVRYNYLPGFNKDLDYLYPYFTGTYSGAYEITVSNVGKLTLGINVTNNADTVQQQLEDFAKEAYFDSWAELKQAFVDKGWTVTWQYGGTTTSITYDLRGGRVIPCPIYTQLVEVEDKDNAEYTNEDGTKFYNIEWGHEVQNPQDYVQFDSLEDAAISYGVILKG